MTELPPPPEWLARVAETAHENVSLVRRLAGQIPGGKRSAVLMLFGPDPDGGENVVLTERSATLRKHPGQVSFPGGMIDPTDESSIAAAMREAEEEVGLSPEGVEILGQMPQLPLSVTGFSVTPVLAWWAQPSQIGVVDEAEVARVIQLRLDDLVNPENRFTATHPRGFSAPAFEVGDVYVWGFTAIVLAETLNLAGLTKPWDESDRRQVPDRFITR